MATGAKGTEDQSKEYHRLGPEAYIGWRARLLARLDDALQKSEPAEQRTALLLAVVARLPLHPGCGLEGHSTCISQNLVKYLKNVSFSSLSTELTYSDVQLLEQLQCERYSEGLKFDDDGEYSHIIPRTIERNNVVIVRDNVFRFDSDGFAAEEDPSAIRNGPWTEMFVVEEEALKIMYGRLVGRTPGAISEFETFAHSLSVCARLVEDGAIYGDIIKQFLANNFPIAGKSEQITAWKLMVTLLLKGSLNFLNGESDSSNCAFQGNLLETVMCCAKKMAISLNAYINSDDANFEISTDTDYHLQDGIIQYYRLLVTVLDILLLPLRSKYAVEREVGIVSNGLSVCRKQLFVVLLRDFFIFIDNLLPSHHSLVVRAINQFSSYFVQFCSRIALLNKSTGWDRKVNSKKFIGFEQKRRMYLFVHEIITEIIGNCSNKAVLFEVLSCAVSLPNEYYSSINTISLIETYLSDHLINDFMGLCTEIIVKQQHNFNTECVTALPDVLMVSLQKKIGIWQGTNLLNLLQALSSICPFLLVKDVERVCLAVLKRFKSELPAVEPGEGGSDGTRTDAISVQCTAMADFLAEHLAGQEAIQFGIRGVVLPIIGIFGVPAALFDLIYAICRRCIANGNLLICPEMMEELAYVLHIRLSRELTFARADIWTLIAAVDFAIPVLHVMDLLLMLLSHYTKEDLPSWFVKRVGQYSLAFLDVALVWMQAPGDIQSHMLRISQLLTLSLQVAVASGLAEGSVPEEVVTKILRTESLVWNVQLLECTVRALLLVTYSPLPSRQVPETSAIDNIRSHICLVSIRLLQEYLQHIQSVTSLDEYCIRKICCTLRHALVSAELEENEKFALFDELKAHVLHLLQQLGKTSVSSDCFRTVLALYFHLVSVNYTPLALRNVLAITNKAYRLQVAVQEVLLELMETEEIEAKDVYVFPQKIYPVVKFFCKRTELAQKCELQSENRQVLSSSAPAMYPCMHTARTSGCVQAFSHSLKDLGSSEYDEYRFDRHCAAQLTLNGILCLTDGLTVSFWLLGREHQKKDVMDVPEELHPICSLGSDGLSFLLQLSSDGHTLYLSNIVNNKIVGCKRLRMVLRNGAWNHIAVSLIVVHYYCLLNIWINSQHLAMRVDDDCVQSRHSAFVFGFGALCGETSCPRIVYELSQVMAFKGRLKAEQVLILRALGSDCISLAACNISTLTLRLTSLLSTVDIVAKQNSLLELFSDVGTAYTRLQQSFLFVIRDSLAYVQWKFSSRSNLETVEHGHLPPAEKYLLRWNCPMVKRLGKASLEDCLLALGSQNLFIFMFAQSINLKRDEYDQAIGLRLLLRFLRRTSPFMGEWILSNIYSYILRCLSSPLAVLGVQMLQGFYAGCFSLPSNSSSSEKMLNKWLIIDPELIVSLICTPEIWRGRERMQQWCSILKDLAQCLSEETAGYSAFNREQLKRVNFLQKFFQALLEMLQDSKNYLVEDRDAILLVEAQLAVIRALLCFPVTTEEIVRLWNFIFLSHAAADTFITYGYTDDFLWLKNEILQEKNEYNSSKDTDLVRCLKNYVKVLGKERIAEIWAKERSVIKVRQLFEAARVDNPIPVQCVDKQPPHVADEKNASDPVCGLQGIEGCNTSGDCTGKKASETKEERLVDWFSDLRSKSLEHLAVVVQNAPDMSIGEIVNMRISWQAVITLLTNQPDPCFRDHLFILLKHFLLRANSKVRTDFMKMGGFELLSNQIKGYPVTDQMASALFSLMCEEVVRFNDGLDADHISSLRVNRFKCLSLKAIFALWEESVRHSTLSVYWNISSSLTTIFNANEMLMQAMMDVGLCATVASLLRRIAALPFMTTDLAHVNASGLFMEGWFGIVKKIVHRCLPYRNSRMYAMCQKLLWLLKMTVLQAGPESERITRQGLSCLLGLWLSVLQKMYYDDDTSERNSTNSLTGSTESADDQSISSVQQDVSPASAFLAEAFSPVLETVADFRDYMKCPYKSNCSRCLPSVNERTERLIYCATEISHFFTGMPIKSPEAVTSQETKLFDLFLSFLTAVWKRNDAAVATFERVTSKQRLMNACRDRTGLLFGPLIAFSLFPSSTKVTKSNNTPLTTGKKANDWELKKCLMIVKALLSNKNNLKQILDVNLEYQCALNLSLHELALLGNVEDESAQQDIEILIKFLRNLQIESPLSTLTTERLRSLNTDELLAIQDYLDYRIKLLATMQQRADQYIIEEKKRSGNRNEAAMRMTCRVVEEQNVLRKNFMKACKEWEVKSVAADQFLGDLVTQLCHPEGVCHDLTCWPSSWALDPTEGPNRERRRLRSMHLTFDSRFLRQEYMDKLKKREVTPPLFQILGGLRRNVEEWSLADGLVPGERIVLSLPAVVVRSTVESAGEILAGDKKFYFHSDHTRSIQKGLSRENTLFVSWSYEDLVDIYKRHHLLEDTALEIFLSDGQTYLIVFQEQAKRDQFASQILSSELCKLNSYSNVSIQSTTQLWREGTITNFEYLMQLNKLAGRSYNDLMQYPVFPFVLSDYKSNVLDLNDSASFRDLSRPMAIQEKRMEHHYVSKYNYLRRESAHAVPGCGSPFVFGPYHYGSHYSNIGIVAHYLVRLPPFTDIALEYQDDSFDIADRLFNSIETTWRLASCDSTTDFKELIPEFFYLPDFLMNNEGLNLGVRQNGDIVDDVLLPRWCQGSPRLFVLIHRQALESSVISLTLNHWIDLIFGYKQTGKPAIDAINVFHPATYRANTMNSISEESDELSLSALRAMVQTYGQMPSQLFQSPHLPHLFDKGHHNTTKILPSPLDTVKGIRWGEFVGSPATEYGNLTVVLDENSHCSTECIRNIVAFSEGNCFAFPSSTCLIYKYKEGGRPREFCSYGLITWRYNDGIIRLRLQEPKLWWDLANCHTYCVTATAYCVPFDLLFVGLSCGIICVYRILLCQFGVKDFALVKTLYGHDSAVSAIALCGDFAVAASACHDGKVCIWDLNHMAYVRTLVPSCDREAQFICISRTSCDIAVVARYGYGSRVMLYTINGLEIGSVTTDITVTAVAMTSLPEGTAVNCLFLGMQNGVIRIFDMWKMKAVRDIIDYRFLEPIVSMSFSNRCTRLFVCSASGRVFCWQGENLQPKRSPSLKIITDK